MKIRQVKIIIKNIYIQVLKTYIKKETLGIEFSDKLKTKWNNLKNVC